MVQYKLSASQFMVLESLLHLGSMSQKVISRKLWCNRQKVVAKIGFKVLIFK